MGKLETRSGTTRPPILSVDFERRLKALLGRGQAGALQAGRVSIIGLDRVREHFGAAWKRLAARADQITRNTIKRYLLPGDIFAAFGGTNYVIVFASLDNECARMKCFLIAREVTKALLGEEGAELISVGTAVAQLDGTFSFDQMMSADRPFDSPIQSVAAVPSELEARLESATAARARPATPEGPHFHFQPMWDTAKAVLSTYLCTPVDGHHRAELYFGQDRESLARLDFASQKCVLGELTRLSNDGCKVLICVSVHFETLAAATHRRQYLQALEQGLPRDAARLLVIEIADVPEGVPQSRMYDLTTPLTRYCRAFVARVRLESTDFSAFRGTRVAAVGCNIAAYPASELTIIQCMNRFVRAAEKVQLETYVRGLRSVSLTSAAAGAGFRYIDGDSIGEFVQHPTHIVKFGLNEVYR
jgi:hypothetical protein